MKNIVLLSDGTGNSSATLFKTNVWRLYEALDTGPGIDQVMYFDDGVGTASFRPLAILGGALGWGLKRNVLDLYRFLCANYREGDRIFLFGFSRGAFTIRVLLGLIDRQGVILGEHGAELARLAKWAFREYRGLSKRPGTLVGPLRWFRDKVFRRIEAVKKPYTEASRVFPDVEFIGAWDTVAAYGLPVDELADGWDRWIWPLTLRTRVPNPKIRKACHALSLDDERQTFHPLLWDERDEAINDTSTSLDQERVSQVWFAGMHANVGGGYPDDGMAHEPLHWIAGEASRRGLLLKPVPFSPSANQLQAWRERAMPVAPMADSRSGVGSYYRYSPRRVAQLTNDAYARVVVRRPKIHESVFTRMTAGATEYAPIVLPEQYSVARSSGAIEDQDTHGFESAAQATQRARGQESVWNLVWLRRIVYFVTVIASLTLVSLPLWPSAWVQGILNWAMPSWSAVIGALGGLLPTVASTWVEHFQEYPVQLLVFGGIVVVLSIWGSSLKQRIGDRMFDVWRDSRNNVACPPMTAAGVWVYRLRTHPAYQWTYSVLKRTVVPNVFGFLTLMALIGTVVVLVTRATFDVKSVWEGSVCVGGGTATARAVGSWEDKEFWSSQICHPTGVVVERGAEYTIAITLPSRKPEDPQEGTYQRNRRTGRWMDRGHIVTSLEGFATPSLAFLPGLPLRRHLGLRWFVPVARIGDRGAEYYPLQQEVTTITPRKDGEIFLYVNDALVPCPMWTCLYENNNGGPATVIVTRTKEAPPG